MIDLTFIHAQLIKVENEVTQYFLHNPNSLDIETIKSIKLTVGNIIKHALTANGHEELVKDLVLLEKLFQHHQFDEGIISPTFYDVKYELEMDYQEVKEVKPISLKQDLDSQKPKAHKGQEQKLISQSKHMPSKLDEILKQYKDVRKRS